MIRKNIEKCYLMQPKLVLAYFGFYRTVYGNKKNISARKWRWLNELKQEREKDIGVEII
jgi:hypothetical protein